MAAKALGISPFSEHFAQLSQPQIMWAILNYYKDTEDDFEKYKLLCRFINPPAAQSAWPVEVDPETMGVSDDLSLYEEIMKHTKVKLTPQELKERLENPEQFDTTLDKIERV